eukprot:gene11323-18597_t
MTVHAEDHRPSSITLDLNCSAVLTRLSATHRLSHSSASRAEVDRKVSSNFCHGHLYDLPYNLLQVHSQVKSMFVMLSMSLHLETTIEKNPAEKLKVQYFLTPMIPGAKAGEVPKSLRHNCNRLHYLLRE